MATFAFLINGVAATIITPVGQIAWRRTVAYAPLYAAQYNYICLVEFFDDIGVQRTLEMRLFTDGIIRRKYQLANQGVLTDPKDILLSSSMLIRLRIDSEEYYADSASIIDITAVSGAPDCDGTFDSQLKLYGAPPDINPTLPVLTDSSSSTIITITHSSFTAIPII